MFTKLTPVRLIALVSAVALSCIASPAFAQGYDAKNADKVDGKHAVSSTNTASKRRNKLVAAGKTGFLPNNIIKMAPNAAKLGGKTLTEVVAMATDTYTAGTGLGLAGGAFSLLPGFSLPQECTADQVVQFDDPGWGCLTLPEGTAYTAGDGLDLTGGVFSVDTSVIQGRVSGSCSAGQYIRIVNADGTVTCGTDADTNTTYTAGTGLALAGGSFSVNFAGSGAATTAARSDHNHTGTYLGVGAKAADSNLLDGFDSLQLISNSCPGGYVSDGSLCWEFHDQASFTLGQAANRCRAAGGRLPLLSEFMAMKLSGIALGETTLLDWTGSSAGDDNSIYINNDGDPANMDGVRANSTASYARCVRPLVNALGSA